MYNLEKSSPWFSEENTKKRKKDNQMCNFLPILCLSSRMGEDKYKNISYPKAAMEGL